MMEYTHGLQMQDMPSMRGWHDNKDKTDKVAIILADESCVSLYQNSYNNVFNNIRGGRTYLESPKLLLSNFNKENIEPRWTAGKL